MQPWKITHSYIGIVKSDRKRENQTFNKRRIREYLEESDEESRKKDKKFGGQVDKWDILDKFETYATNNLEKLERNDLPVYADDEFSDYHRLKLF